MQRCSARRFVDGALAVPVVLRRAKVEEDRVVDRSCLNETNTARGPGFLERIFQECQALIEMDEKSPPHGRRFWEAASVSVTAKRARRAVSTSVTDISRKGEMNREVQESKKTWQGSGEGGTHRGKSISVSDYRSSWIRGRRPHLAAMGLDITGQVIDEFNREYP
jgi:hypothetical protein